MVLKGLAEVHSAVHGDALSHDKQVCDKCVYDLRDLLGATRLPDRHTRGELLARILIARRCLFALDQDWGNGVDDVWCQETGERAGEPN